VGPLDPPWRRTGGLLQPQFIDGLHRQPISIDEFGALHGEMVLFDLVRDSELAVFEVGDPQVIGRAEKQGMRDFILERQVPLFEIANVDIHRHDILQILPLGARSMPLTTSQADKRASRSLSARNAAPKRLL